MAAGWETKQKKPLTGSLWCRASGRGAKEPRGKEVKTPGSTRKNVANGGRKRQLIHLQEQQNQEKVTE
jgi:hypothetical protein